MIAHTIGNLPESDDEAPVAGMNTADGGITPLRSDYRKLHVFADDLVRRSSDMPPEFSRVLVEDFWDLV